MFPDTESLPHDEPDRVGAGRFGIGRPATLLADPRFMGDLDESRGYSPAEFEKTD